MEVLFLFAGLTGVLASGLMPAYDINGPGAGCELGVWRTKCSWNTNGTFDLPTYDVDLVQDKWVVPAMEVTYTTVLVLGIATMVWQLAAGREGACLQAKAHGWHCCNWALHIFTTLLGVAYPVFVRQFGTNFWIVLDAGRWDPNVRPGDNYSLGKESGLFVGWTGAFFLVLRMLLRCIAACLNRPAPLKTVAVIPEESQRVVGQAVNTAVYHTCA